jgi:hypothetical protein
MYVHTPILVTRTYTHSRIYTYTELGKVTLKINGDEALSDESVFKSNGDKVLNRRFFLRINGNEAFNIE